MGTRCQVLTIKVYVISFEFQNYLWGKLLPFLFLQMKNDNTEVVEDENLARSNAKVYGLKYPYIFLWFLKLHA